MQQSLVHRSQDKVPFPEFTSEKIYMVDVGHGFPKNLHRWQDTVESMLSTIEFTKGSSVFLTVDQSPVKKGIFHRRPGIHVDGTWMDSLSAGHRIPGHRIPGHVIQAEGHKIPTHYQAIQEEGSPLGTFQALILATNFLGSVAYEGEFYGYPGVGGDCSNIDTGSTVKVDLDPGYAWAGDTNSLLHEAVPACKDCFRTLVRLNVDNCSYFK